jgi:hypothetical protein
MLVMIHLFVCVCVSIYIYIEREREREREREFSYIVDKSQPLICVTLEIVMVKVNVFNDLMVIID